MSATVKRLSVVMSKDILRIALPSADNNKKEKIESAESCALRLLWPHLLANTSFRSPMVYTPEKDVYFTRAWAKHLVELLIEDSERGQRYVNRKADMHPYQEIVSKLNYSRD